MAVLLLGGGGLEVLDVHLELGEYEFGSHWWKEGSKSFSNTVGYKKELSSAAFYTGGFRGLQMNIVESHAVTLGGTLMVSGKP